MTGKHHLASGASTYLAMASIPMVPSVYHGPFSEQVATACSFYSGLYYVPSGISSEGVGAIVGLVLSILMFFLGVLLPDVDSKGSILGKFIYLPFRHRTWTHTFWPIIIFLGLSFLWTGFFWLAMGMIAHLFIDSISFQGVCWFYPLSKYRYYPNGGAVKKKHWLKLYRTGSKTEAVVCYIYIIICIVIFALVSVCSWRSLGALASEMVFQP